MKIGELLRNSQTRISAVSAAETVAMALQVMRDDNVGMLVVKDVCRTEHDTVLGTITERDVVAALSERGPAVLKQPVRAAMARKFISCSPNDSLAHVLDLMDSHGLSYMPVIEGYTLIGIISVHDVIKLQLRRETGRGREQAEVAA
jgi:CBS domain-containing protein